ncbi:MAG: hypothetical protein IKV13_00730 [Akkermansia sp.]|nr:hypothetical protein [Akkermansia sp.]
MNRFILYAMMGALPALAAVEFDAIYGDGMVLQRGREVQVRGTTDNPSEPVTVQFNGQKVKAEVKGKNWRAVLQPMEANAQGQPLEASQKDSSAVVQNVVVGEVWIASGQSNMLWRLNQTPGNAQTIAQSANDNFRFYHSEPQVHTSPPRYDAALLQRVQEKRMYEGKWAVSAPASSPRMSAVGYYFGQALQKELGVPVGVIHASLGGSNMLAWIPRAMVKKEYPGCEGGDWVKSKYASAWVRGRAQQNVGPGGDFGLHPYAPSYLYETGIEPWEGFPVAGVIWYQGESDAEILDNEQNKKLLKDLIISWRDKLGNEELPFLQVQLPRINDKSKLRAYWPEFRQVQAEVAEELPAVGCVVTMDLGSTNSDVHPPRKVEVGERLAATALSMVYGKEAAASGPVIQGFKAKGSKVQVSLDNAGGLKTTDGAAPVGFELAGNNKEFAPAAAEIKGDKIILTADAVKAPRYMRYGWAVFMEPNLVNEAGLPTAPYPASDGKTARKKDKKDARKDRKKRK